MFAIAFLIEEVLVYIAYNIIKCARSVPHVDIIRANVRYGSIIIIKWFVMLDLIISQTLNCCRPGFDIIDAYYSVLS